MSRDARGPVPKIMEPEAALPGLSSPAPGTPLHHHAARRVLPAHMSRMQYRSRPVSVAVDPVSLVISECIAITSAIQKFARSPHSSVSAILGGGPSPVQLGPPSPGLRSKSKSPAANLVGDGTNDLVRWGLRGKKGKSMQDNPLISGFGRLRHELTGIKGIVVLESYRALVRLLWLTCKRHI